MPLRLLLANDHTLMRQGLRHILESNSEFDIVAEASSGIEAVEAAREHKPDVAIVDVAMKELNGIETTSQILKHSPHTAVLILSMYSDERYVLRAVKAGARLCAEEFRGRGTDPRDLRSAEGNGIFQPGGGADFSG